MKKESNLDWIPTDAKAPNDDEVVWTMDSGGHVQKLRKRGNLWHFEDNSMYVYYIPKMWKPLSPSA